MGNSVLGETRALNALHYHCWLFLAESYGSWSICWLCYCIYACIVLKQFALCFLSSPFPWQHGNLLKKPFCFSWYQSHINMWIILGWENIHSHKKKNWDLPQKEKRCWENIWKKKKKLKLKEKKMWDSLPHF